MIEMESFTAHAAIQIPLLFCLCSGAIKVYYVPHMFVFNLVKPLRLSGKLPLPPASSQGLPIEEIYNNRKSIILRLIRISLIWSLTRPIMSQSICQIPSPLSSPSVVPLLLTATVRALSSWPFYNFPDSKHLIQLWRLQLPG